ncbi:MAG: hypothetical protein ABW082_14285 [Sedimenticola sp.]
MSHISYNRNLDTFFDYYRDIQDKSIDEAIEWASNKIESQKLTIALEPFGVSIITGNTHVLIFTVLFSLQLFILFQIANLLSALRQISLETSNDYTVMYFPWIGINRSGFFRIISFITLVLLPIISLIGYCIAVENLTLIESSIYGIVLLAVGSCAAYLSYLAQVSTNFRKK